MVESRELEDIRSLLTDFPTAKKYTPEQVIRISNIRYSELDDVLKRIFIPNLQEKKHLSFDIFLRLAKALHQILFQDIFFNAGEFRKASDPSGGYIYFGPYDRRSGRTAKFSGISPEKILEELTQVFQIYSSADSEPSFNAIKVYQQFVYVHPFYDANGRVGRLLTNVYLEYHNYIVLWKLLEKNEEKKRFIAKLNRCHTQMGKPHYESRLKELHKFWTKYVKQIPRDEI